MTQKFFFADDPIPAGPDEDLENDEAAEEQAAREYDKMLEDLDGQAQFNQREGEE